MNKGFAVLKRLFFCVIGNTSKYVSVDVSALELPSVYSLIPPSIFGFAQFLHSPFPAKSRAELEAQARAHGLGLGVINFSFRVRFRIRIRMIRSTVWLLSEPLIRELR
jgi:hypothetical protein